MPFFKLLWAFVLSLVFILLIGKSTSADIYRYKDENGVWHFSNIKSNKHYKVYIRQGSKRISAIDKYEEIIILASRQYQVDCALIKAIIKAESDFDHRALSKKGAQGLMQLMPDTADKMEVEDPFDPKENILAGTRYFSLLLKKFKNDKTLALAAYNAGPEEVESRNGVPPFPETKKYVKKVLTYYRTFNGDSE